MTDSTRVQLSPRTGAPERARLRTEPGLGPISALSIALDSRGNCWRVRVHAELSPASTWRVGEILVPAPLTPSEGSRVVALACCPGAVGWAIDALPVVAAPPYDTTTPSEKGYLEIAAADVGLLELGIHPIGRVELVGSRRRYTGGGLAAGNTAITIGPERRIQRISAWQDGVGAIFNVNGGAVVPLPPNGAATLETDQFGWGPAAVWFQNFPALGGGYTIDFLE